MLYLKIANSAVIIVWMLLFSGLSAMLGHPWEQPEVLEAFYLLFCGFRNISLILLLSRIKIILLFAAIYSVFVSVNLFLSILYGDLRFLTDRWNNYQVITLQSAFVNSAVTGVILYVIWIILTVIKEDKYLNNRDLR